MIMVRTVQATKIGSENLSETVELTILKERYIGSGVFSNVYKATLQNPNITVAIKKTWPEPEYKARHKEIHLLLYRHPHVSNMLYYFNSRHANHETNCWNLVLEYLPSSVRKIEEEHENSGTRIAPFDVKLWSYQLFCALEYMHNKNVCHRDIKPDNMLLDPESGLLQLGDLGSAKIIKEHESSEAYQVTRYYRAPELILGYRNYGLKIDDWAGGCVLGGLGLGSVLFQGENNNDQLMCIMKVLGTPSVAQMNAMHPPECPKRDWPQLPKKEWLQVFERQETHLFDLLEKLLQYDPKKRSSAGEACRHHYYDQLKQPDTRMPNGKPLPISPENLGIRQKPAVRDVDRRAIRKAAVRSSRDQQTQATQSAEEQETEDTAEDSDTAAKAPTLQKPKRRPKRGIRSQVSKGERRKRSVDSRARMRKLPSSQKKRQKERKKPSVKERNKDKHKK